MHRQSNYILNIKPSAQLHRIVNCLVRTNAVGINSLDGSVLDELLPVTEHPGAEEMPVDVAAKWVLRPRLGNKNRPFHR